MSIDKSLKRRSGGASNRSVLTRAERITKLKDLEKWTDGRSPFGLPKVRVVKVILKKAKKEKAAEGEGEAKEGAAAAPAAAPPKAPPKAPGKK